jgi:hypothetical protein
MIWAVRESRLKPTACASPQGFHAMSRRLQPREMGPAIWHHASYIGQKRHNLVQNISKKFQIPKKI